MLPTVERPRPFAHTSCSSKLSLAAISPRQIIGPLDRDVESIAYDSRRVQKNGLFVALRGEKSDGHEFIEQAIEKGATRRRGGTGDQASARDLCRGREHPRRARGSRRGFLRTSRAPTEDGRRHRHERQDDDDVFAQAHLREGGTALRVDRNRPLRNRRSAFYRRRARRRNRSTCRSCSRRS